MMEKHGADSLYSAVKSVLQAIRTENEEDLLVAAHRILQSG